MISSKILLINIKQNSERTGATIYAEELFFMARNSGLDADLMVVNGSPFSNLEGVITLPYIKNKLLRWLLYVLLVPFYARNYAIVHFSLDLPIISTRLFYLLSGKKIITTVHDLGEFRTRRYSRSKDFLRKILVTAEILCCHQFVVVSKRTKTDLMELFSIDESDISLVYNAPKVNIEEHWESKLYPKLSGINEKPYFLYISSLNHPLKNHVGLIDAFEGVADYLVEYHVVFVGAKLYNHEYVLERIETSLYSNRIHYFGYLPQDQVHFLYSNAFAYVFPSKFEGFGRGVIEAWKYNLPLVCSTGGSLEEIVGDAGVTFDPNSSDEMGKAILLVASDEALRKDLIRKGIERLNIFSEENVSHMLVDTYSKSLK